ICYNGIHFVWIIFICHFQQPLLLLENAFIYKYNSNIYFHFFQIFFRLFSFCFCFVIFIKSCVKLNHEHKEVANHMKMYADERREHIYTYIKSHKRATVRSEEHTSE